MANQVTLGWGRSELATACLAWDAAAGADVQRPPGAHWTRRRGVQGYSGSAGDKPQTWTANACAAAPPAPSNLCLAESIHAAPRGHRRGRRSDARSAAHRCASRVWTQPARRGTRRGHALHADQPDAGTGTASSSCTPPSSAPSTMRCETPKRDSSPARRRSTCGRISRLSSHAAVSVVREFGSGFGVRGSGSRFGVRGSGFRVPGARFEVRGSGFRVRGRG